MQKKIKNLINNKFFLIILSQLLIVFAAWKNIFPKGYIFSGADVRQYFNFERTIHYFNYVWSAFSEGSFVPDFSYSLYYFFLYLIELLFKISPSDQSFLYYFIFLAGSFWSFYYSLRFYFEISEVIDVKYKVILSLVYTFNLFTLYNFFYTWGYSPFFFLYVLIPVIFGATYKYFSDFNSNKINYKLLSLLGIFFFLSNIANGNIPFFISLNIFLFLFIALFYLLHFRKIKLILYFKKVIMYYCVYFCAIFWSIVPQISEMMSTAQLFKSGQHMFNLKDWLFWQAVHLPNIFFLTGNINLHVSRISLFCYLSLFLFLIATVSFILNKHKKKLATIFFLLLCICIFLLNKGIDILINRDLIWAVFNNPILGSLRSSDKTLLFLPFFLTIIIFINFKNNFDKYRFLLYFLLIVTLLSVYPFFTGGIQTRYSVAFEKRENYLTAEYAYLHKIPQEYLNLAQTLNVNLSSYKIFNIPYSVLNSEGWVNFPKWKVVGVDPTEQLFDFPIVQMNSYGAFGFWNYGRFWNNQGINESKWILPFAGLLNTKYIIYHKDVDKQFIKQTIGKVRYYEKENLITKLDENEYFNLYELNSRYFLPRFYIPQDIIYLNGEIEILPDIVSFEDYEIRSAIYLSGITDVTDVNAENTDMRWRTLLGRADEVFVKAELGESFENSVPFPYVRWGPGSLIYPLVLKREQFEKWKVRKDPEKIFERHLLYASKRIAELVNFEIRDIKELNSLLESYKQEMEGAIREIREIEKLRTYLEAHRRKVDQSNIGEDVKDGVRRFFDELEEKINKLEVKQDFSRLVYRIKIPKSGSYELFIKYNDAEKNWMRLGEENFEKGEQELTLAFSGISENLVDENLRVRNYSPNSIYRISFDYKDPRGGSSFFIAEEEGEKVAETVLLSTGEKFRHFERFFKSSSEAKRAIIHLAVPEEKNLKVERIYQPKVMLRSIKEINESTDYNKKVPKITFVRINPTRYKVKVEGAKEPYTLVFSESFHRGWKAYISDQQSVTSDQYGGIVASYFDGEIKEGTHQNIFLDRNTFETWGKKPIVEERHLLVNGYANSWYITPEDGGGKENYEIIIEFWPQRLFYIGLGISLATFLGCLGYLGIEKIKKNKKLKN